MCVYTYIHTYMYNKFKGCCMGILWFVGMCSPWISCALAIRDRPMAASLWLALSLAVSAQ